MDLKLSIGCKVLISDGVIGCVIGHDGDQEGSSPWMVLEFCEDRDEWGYWGAVDGSDLKVIGDFGMYHVGLDDQSHPLSNPREICDPDNSQSIGLARELYNSNYGCDQDILVGGEWDIYD